MFELKVHSKLYALLYLVLVLPLTILMIGQWTPTQSLPWAFLALTFVTRLMMLKDKAYLDRARKKSRDLYFKEHGKAGKLGEIEVAAHKIVESRQMVFFVIGFLQLCHLILI
jgi:membrane protein implicated in regulation of membrane protease activity